MSKAKTVKVQDITAVQWSWRSDNGWVDYDKKTCIILENGYANDEKKVSVDKERFVDLSLSVSELKKNFHSIDCPDKEFVGIQRRFDDEMKRRAVRRQNPEQFLKGANAFIAVSNSTDADHIASALRTYGGVVSKNITKRTKVVITSVSDMAKFQDDIGKAQEADIPLVKEDWLVDCIKQETLAEYNAEKYHVLNNEENGTQKKKKKKEESTDDEEEKPKKKKKKKEESEEEEEEKPKKKKEENSSDEEKEKSKKKKEEKSKKKTDDSDDEKPKKKKDADDMDVDGDSDKKSKKRKADDSDSDSDNKPKKKKAKIDDSSSSSTSSSSSSNASNVNSTSLSSSGKGSATADFAIKHVALRCPSHWMGVCSYEAGEDFPFTMEITSVSVGKASGFINWPTLDNARTKFRGTINGDSFTFEEYEAVVSPDKVQIPSNYKGKIENKGKTIKGHISVEDDDSQDSPSFHLDLVETDLDDSEPETDQKKDFMKVGAKASGKVVIEYPFVIKVSKRQGDSVEGTIHWEHQKCTTKFKGKVGSNDEITFEEYEIVKKEDEKESVPVPMMYSGKFNNEQASLEGSFGPVVGKESGKFKVTLDK
eukprot:TRINITY_DN3719_c0_g1_i1.p1 TRINITY_DN3719_c0_g1~~TRINITY_DN3719_c0_g1_i1.p1  ORF type:complete len:594 (-),score=192.94 TRINITY_DN3719_c0_g1_i1:18-1799(-)